MSTDPQNNLSGRLNQRITLQQKVRTPDGAGGSSLVWQDVATLWAEVAPGRSIEALTHDKLMLRNLHRITIRYRSDVTADKRFVLGSRVFLIIGIVDVNESRHSLEITASEEI